MKTNNPFVASLVLLATTCNIISAQAQNPPCFLCDGDLNATFLLPDKEIPVDDTTTVTCGEVFTSAVNGEFTPDECDEASMSDELAEFCGCSNLQSSTAAPVEAPISPIATTQAPTTIPIRDGTIPPADTPLATLSPSISPTPPKTATVSPTISPTPPKTAPVSPTISPTPPKTISDAPSNSPLKSSNVPLTTPVAQNTLNPTTAPGPVETLAPTIAPSATTVLEPTVAPVIAGSGPPSISPTTPCKKTKKKRISMKRKGTAKSNGSGKRKGKRDTATDNSEERLLRTSGNGGDDDDEYEYECPKPKRKTGMMMGKEPSSGEQGIDDDDTATPSKVDKNKMALKEKGGVKEKKQKSASLRYL